MSAGRTNGAGPLRIRLLGAAEVRADGTVIEALASPRLQSLLAYLIVNRHSAHSRQRLAFLFWPDSSEPQARTNLRQALHILRHALPDSDRFIVAAGPTLQWSGDEPALVDVVDFEDAARRARAGGDRVALESAASIYSGDLLPGCYDDWVQPERQRLRQQYAVIVEELITVTDGLGDHVAAIRHAEQLLRLDGLDEERYRRLMRLHVRAGQRARALRVYHECVTTLGRELGVRPSPETVEVYERLLAEPSQHQAVPPVVGVPLVGRDAEWGRLVACWEAAAEGRAQLVMVTGEAGIGKSRLVEDFRAWCARGGHPTTTSRAYEAEGNLSYGPVVDALRSPAVHHVVSTLEPVWQAELARLLPELVVEQQPELARTGPVGEGERTRLFEALARAVTSVAVPLLVVFDDLQWCDAETLEFLHFLLRFGRASRLLVVGTARDEEVGPEHPLTSLVAGLRAIDAVVELRLGRLDPPTARALAEGLIGADEPTLERVVAAAEGNPLFLVEIARSGLAASKTDTPTPPATLPPRVQAVIEGRLAKLSDAARQLVDAAAVVGRAFTLNVVTPLLRGPNDDDVVAAIDELWRRGIVQERDVDAYDFSHDKIREVAYSSIGPARRRRLHGELARTLTDLHIDALDAVAAQIAVHYERAGSLEQAIDYYQRAVEVGRRVYAHDDVIALSRRGLELVARQPPSAQRDERELSFLVPMAIALHAGGTQRPDDRWVYERATDLRAQLGLPPDPSTVRTIANLAITQRDFPQAQAHGEQLLARAEETGDPLLLTEGHYLLGVSTFWQGALELSRHHLSRALTSYSPERTAQHLALFGQDPKAVCLTRLAWTTWHLGHFDEAEVLTEQGLAYAHRLEHTSTEAYVHLFAAWLAADAGRPDRAAALVDGLAAEFGLTWLAAGREIFLAWAEVQYGQAPVGARRLEEALEATRACGSTTCEPMALMLLARTCSRLGDDPAGLRHASDALAIAEREMQIHEAEASRLYGQLLARAGGEPHEIERAFRRAVTVATRQGNVVAEVRARTSLAKWFRGADPQSHDPELEALRRRFPAVAAVVEVADVGQVP